MQFETLKASLATARVDCVAVGIHDDGELPASTRALDTLLKGRLKALAARGDLSTRLGDAQLRHLLTLTGSVRDALPGVLAGGRARPAGDWSLSSERADASRGILEGAGVDPDRVYQVSVPANQRAGAHAVALNKFTAEQVKSFHKKN